MLCLNFYEGWHHGDVDKMNTKVFPDYCRHLVFNFGGQFLDPIPDNQTHPLWFEVNSICACFLMKC